MPGLYEEHMEGVESPDFFTCGLNTHVSAKLAWPVEAIHQLTVLGSRAFGSKQAQEGC